MSTTFPPIDSWREERRKDRLILAEIARADQAAAAETAIAERAADAQLRHAAEEKRRERAAEDRARAGAWVSARVLHLLFVPVIVVPCLLAWTAMAVYGMDLYGGIGVLLPLFSEFAMWAFAAAVTITRHRDARRQETDPDAGASPVWHLRAGVVAFAAFAALLNFAHGLSAGPHHGPLTATVMAAISTAGVIAHQLITAGPKRTRAGRHDKTIGTMVEDREFGARKTAVRAADVVIDEDGRAELVWPAAEEAAVLKVEEARARQAEAERRAAAAEQQAEETAAAARAEADARIRAAEEAAAWEADEALREAGREVEEALRLSAAERAGLDALAVPEPPSAPAPGTCIAAYEDGGLCGRARPCARHEPEIAVPGESKKDHLLRLYRAHPMYDVRAWASRTATELAGHVQLSPGTARAYVYSHLNSGTEELAS